MKYLVVIAEKEELKLVEHFDGNIMLYSIMAMATRHADGSRDFYSEPVLNSFKELMNKRGDIIKINNLFL